MKIKELTPIAWKARITASNTNAMNKMHKYPNYERQYFIDCLEYLDVDCDKSCFCRRIENKGVWVIKKELKFETFLNHYAKLWSHGSSSLIYKVNDPNIKAKGREKNSVEVLRKLKDNWENWDNQGESLPVLANQIKCTILCDNSFDRILPFLGTSVCTGDTTGVYTSKMISQIFPDIIIPFDTASKSIMKLGGYDPELYGKGKLKTEVVDFINRNELSASEFRSFDDAPATIWKGSHSLPNGDVTTFSRVIDKLFYG